MTMPEVVAYFERYAASFAAPVRSGIEVRAVTRVDDEFRVETTGGDWMATTVVVATGYADRPAVPGVAARMPRRDRAPRAHGLPDARAAAGGRRARGGRVGVRYPARGRAESRGPRRDDRGWTPYPIAAAIPGPRHPVVARPDGRVRRDRRSGLRRGDLARTAVAAARRPSRPRDDRSLDAAGTRRARRGPARRCSRRCRALRRRSRGHHGRRGHQAGEPAASHRHVRPGAGARGGLPPRASSPTV